MSPRARKVTALLLLAVGIQLWLIWAQGLWKSGPNLLVALGCFLFVVVPPFRRVIWETLAPARHPSPRVRGIVAVSLAVVSSVYLWATAAAQGRTLLPRFHDEF